MVDVYRQKLIRQEKEREKTSQDPSNHIKERTKLRHSDGGLKKQSRTRTKIERHKKNRENILESVDQNLIVCPICGEKGFQLIKFIRNKGSSYTYIKHLTGLEELSDGRVKRKAKECFIGRVATDDWDMPKTVDGFKAIMGDLIMVLRGMVVMYYAKSPKSRVQNHKVAAELQNLISQYERYVDSDVA